MADGESTGSAKKGTGQSKRPARKRTVSKRPEGSSNGNEQTRQAPRAEAKPSPSASRVAALAANELLELTGKQAEGVVGLERTEDGWVVQVEVVEVRRIPETTDVLAIFEVTTDRHGSLQGYRRVRRFIRGVPGEES